MAPVADRTFNRLLFSNCGRRLFALALAALSLIIYGSTIFTLPQVRSARYCCEQSSVAAAVSNVMYRARVGTLYSGVFDYFYAHFDEPLELTLREAQMPGIGLPPQPPGELDETTRDGNGVGYPLVATAAFRLFGMHTWALTLTMLLLMGLSAAIFLWRFSGVIYVGVVILYFTALTVMLFTPLVWDPYYFLQIPVGGIRYFSLVSVLPIFHMVLDLIDANERGSGKGRVLRLLGLQTAILVVVTLVRGSAMPLLAAIALLIGVLAWRVRRDSTTLRALFGKAAVIGSVSVCTLAVIVISVPREYLTQGHFGTVIWHRVVESLGTNPAFPFPGVNDMFDCKKYIPKGLQPGISAPNSTCIWYDYVAKHHTPAETRREEMYGSLYETAMRQAFLEIAAQYPADVLKTFVYYKARYIVWSIAQSMRFRFSEGQATPGYPAGAVSLLLVSLVVALTYFSLAKIAANELSHVAGVTLLSAVFTLPSYLAVWAMPHTSADLLLYCIFMMALVVGAGLVFVRQVISRYRASADVIVSKMETT